MYVKYLIKGRYGTTYVVRKQSHDTGKTLFRSYRTPELTATFLMHLFDLRDTVPSRLLLRRPDIRKTSEAIDR